MRGSVIETEAVPFGALLREFRLAAGLSQETLAELAHMSSGGISVLERGTRRAPQRETVSLLANALNLAGKDRERFENAARRAGSARRRGNVPAATVPELGNLPFALTSFIGRERSTAGLRIHLAEQRLVTLTGLGGVGKTRLAIETGHELTSDFPDGVWFVELAPLSDSEMVAPRVAATLGIEAAGDGNAWISDLAQKQLLLILDNCEHLLAACASISKQLLERCPQLRILATSREPLRIAGERVVRVDPLRESSAIELFLDRARDAASAFSTPDSDETAQHYVRTICRGLSGIPLALELAAARVSSLSLKTIAENIDQRLSLLHRGNRASVPRQQTMRALIDWSYDLLSSEEKRAFEELAVCAGGCTLETAAAVFGETTTSQLQILDLLTSLVDKSLAIVDLQVDESRYGLLEISREYAREKLVAHGTLENALRRHADAYLQLALKLREKWRITPARAEYTRAGNELENWRAAIEWSLVTRNDVLLGQRLVAALAQIWLLFAPSEGRRFCRIALEAVDATTPRNVIANLQYTDALIAFQTWDHPASIAAAERALNEWRAIGDRSGVAHAQRIIGVVNVLSGNVSEGEPLLLEALETAREFDDWKLAGLVEGNLGMERTVVDDFPGAIAHFTQARAIFKAAGDEREALTHAINLAEALYKSGDVEAALRLSEETLANARTLDHTFAITNTLSAMAAYSIALNRFDRASELAREAIELYRKARSGVFLLWILQHLAAAGALKAASSSNKLETERSARILGYIGAHLPKVRDTRDFTERIEHERALSVLHATLHDDEIKRLMAEGSAMTEDQAIEEAAAS